MQAEKDAAIEEAKNEKLHAMQISTTNQEMQVTVEALQGEVEELRYQLELANCLVAEYEATRDKTKELEEENGRLKKYLLESLEERKKMRTSTLLAIARARQYEAEFESIQSEWNRNNRMQHMMLMLWPEDEKMYPSTWDDQDTPLTLRSESINWKQVEEEDHHWMWNKHMHIHITWLATKYGQIHTQWLVMDPGVISAKLYLTQKDAFKLDHVGTNSIHIVLSPI